MDKKKSLFENISEEEKGAVLFDRASNFTEKQFRERLKHYSESLLNSFIISYQKNPFTEYIAEVLKEGNAPHYIHKTDSSYRITSPERDRDVLEERTGQKKMMDDVRKTIREESILIAEAPPGTGKSLAYLIPLLENLKDSKRCVISTNTKNLQMQLFNKDLEIASNITGVSVSASMMKGIGNYFCFMKYNENLMKFSPLTKLALEGFIILSGSGDVSEIKYQHELDFGDITCDNEYCVESLCSFAGICPYLKLRERAMSSQIVFTNHYLALIDAELKNKFFGDYNFLVFDEAHNLENVVTDVYSYKFDFTYALRIFNYFAHTFSNQMKFIRSSSLSTDSVNFLESLLASMKDVAEDLDILFKYLIDLAEEEKTERCEYSPKLFSGAYERVKRTGGLMYGLYCNADKAQKMLREEKFRMLDIFQTLKYVFEKTMRFFESFAVVTQADNEEYAFFYEFDVKRRNIVLNGLPVDTGDQFSKMVLSRESISYVFTSATLSAADSFEMFKQQSGLKTSKRKYFEASYQSSFDYEKQMKVFCFKNIGDPVSDKFMEKAAEVVRILSLEEKRMFVLATSYSQIDFLKAKFKERKFIFQRREGNGDKLLHLHKSRKSSVLVGTNMFWEGVDLPGDLLETIVILKMPFAVPDDPIIRRRSRVMEENNRDPFREYTLPQAIIKLKQGMGRLIRKKDDEGKIYILDERILTKSYGKSVLSSFYVRPAIIEYESFIKSEEEK
ncbi:MAG: helicase C-terminal domain-containing protein [bacterium]|nr:helicase C-terminal domain-containing protein [bacterium]